MTEKLDAQSIPGKILAIQNELNGLSRKSKVQRLGKSHYKREEKRLSEQLRQLEWLYDFYSRRPRKTTDEVNSVITDDPSDISDAELESTKTNKLKNIEHNLINSETIPDEKYSPQQRETQEKAKNITEIVEEMENRLKEAKTRFTTRSTVESGKTDITKENKIDEKTKVTKIFQRPTQNNLYKTKSLNPLQKNVETINSKLEKSSSKKVELKLEETKQKQTATTQRKPVNKQENDTKRKKEEKVLKNTNLNKTEEAKPKTKTTRNEIKQIVSEQLPKNTSDESKTDVKHFIENDFYITTYRHRVSKLPETTDPGTKRMLQNKFLSKLKSVQPKISLENNEAQQKMHTNIGNGKAVSNIKVKKDTEKPEKKVERKSKYDKIVKAKVNSWNKEYVTYKASKMSETKSKETTRKVESNLKISEVNCKIKEEEKKNIRKIKGQPLRESLKREQTDDDIKEEKKEKSMKFKIRKNAVCSKTSNTPEKPTKESIKMNEKVKVNSTKTHIEAKEKASNNISNELSSSTLIAFQMEEQEVIKDNSDFNKENRIIGSNKRRNNASNKKGATALKEVDDDWYIGELTPSTSQESVEATRTENTTDYAKPGCSKSDPSKEEISKDFPLEKKPSIIKLEKKDSIVIVKSPRKHSLENKKPSLNVAETNQKIRNKSTERKTNKSNGNKTEVDVKGSTKNKRPPVEVIFQQKLDRRTILVEKLIDYRIDLIHQNFKAEKTEEFSKPSITYI